MSTITQAASTGGTPIRVSATACGDGLVKLRCLEAKGLVSLVTEALSQTHSVGHELHALIYASDGEFDPARCDGLVDEALACWQAADHYLRMLGSVLADLDPYSNTPS
jgi:hypothetical protein